MSQPQVAVVGLKALLRDLKRAGTDTSPLNPVLTAAGRAAAAPIAAAARSAYPSVSGTLSGDVRVNASRTGAAVRAGRASVPYAGPVDFGGYPGDRAYDARGRYLFPSAEPLAETAARAYSEALQRGFDNFPWSNETEAVHD